MDWDLTSPIASTQSNKQLHTVSATKVLLYRKQGNSQSVGENHSRNEGCRFQSVQRLSSQLHIVACMVCPWQSSQASPCLLRYCNFPVISQEKNLNIGFLPAGALTPLAAHEQSCVPCQWPHKDIFSEPGREVVVEKSTPLEKGRNLEITPAEDIKNGHPADSRTWSKMPLHNRKMHKTHSNAHPGLTTSQTVSILYPPELYTKQRAIFLRLRAETVGLYDRFDKVYNGWTQHANGFGCVPKAQVTKNTLFLL